MYLPVCEHLSRALSLTLAVPLSDLSPSPSVPRALSRSLARALTLARSLTLALCIPASQSSGEVTPP